MQFVKAIKLLKDGFNFKIGDGESMFLFYHWLAKESIGSKIPLLHIVDTCLGIEDVW